MPTININGPRPGQPGQSQGPEPNSGQGPQAPRGRRKESGFDRAQRERQRSEKEQARIDAQADRAWRRHEQAQAKFERERERAFRTHEQQERRRQAELNRSTREEVRARETARRAFDLRSGTADRLRMIDSLGRRGMGAAASGRNRDLHQIERTLRNIARATEGQLKFSRSPSERANVARIEDHILSAGRRIALGRQFGAAAGLRPGRLGAAGRALVSRGGGVGAALGELVEGSALAEAATGVGFPLAAATLLGGEAIKTAITIPGKAARLYGSLVAGAAPYTSLRVGTARLGRAGSFNSLAFQKSLYNGSRLPTWMADLGLTPQSVVGLLSQGPVPTSRGAALGTAQDIARAALLPAMPGQEALNSYRQVLQSLGVIMPGSARAIPGSGGSGFTTGLSSQYDKLQKLMVQAVAQGADRSTVLRSTLSYMQSAASSGALSIKPPGEFFSRMLASNLPGARNGTLELQSLAGFNSAMKGAGLGGNISTTMMLLTSGLPTTAAGLRKKLGMSPQQWASFISQPGAKRMVQDYLAAPSPIFKATILGQMMQGMPLAGERFYKQSIYTNAYGGNPAMQDIVEGRVLGIGYAGAVALNSTNRSAYVNTQVNNNPLDLKFANQEGALGADRRGFAKFRSLQAAYAASYRQLKRYQAQGYTTVRQMVTRWAPDASPAYVSSVAQAIGVSPDSAVNLNDMNTARKMLAAMAVQENGVYGKATISAIPGALAMVRGQPQPATGNVPTGVFQMNATAAGLNLNVGRQNFEAARIASNTGAVYAAQQASDFVVKGFTDVGNASVGTAAALEKLKTQIESLLPHVSRHTPIPFSVAPGAGSMPLPGPSRP